MTLGLTPTLTLTLTLTLDPSPYCQHSGASRGCALWSAQALAWVVSPWSAPCVVSRWTLAGRPGCVGPAGSGPAHCAGTPRWRGTASVDSMNSDTRTTCLLQLIIAEATHRAPCSPSLDLAQPFLPLWQIPRARKSRPFIPSTILADPFALETPVTLSCHHCRRQCPAPKYECSGQARDSKPQRGSSSSSSLSLLSSPIVGSNACCCTSRLIFYSGPRRVALPFLYTRVCPT